MKRDPLWPTCCDDMIREGEYEAWTSEDGTLTFGCDGVVSMVYIRFCPWCGTKVNLKSSASRNE